MRGVMGAVALLLCVAFAGTAAAEGDWVGKKATDFKVKDLAGTEYTLEGLKGKVVWLNFWGLRCGPCIRELPALQDLHKRYNDKGLVIIGVNADGVDSDFIKKSFAERDDLKGAGVTFPLVPDMDFLLIDGYGLMGAPLNVIIDRSGTIRFHHEGYEAGDEKRYEEELKKLL